MRIFVLTATYELRVSRKSHLRDHPKYVPNIVYGTFIVVILAHLEVLHCTVYHNNIIYNM